MKKKRKAEHFIKKPTYKGGPKAMLDFIKKNLKYPAVAFEARVEGTVRLRIEIDYKGSVSSSHIISSIGYGCDEEAQRVASLLKFEVPKTRKLRASFNKTLNFHFKLPKPTDKQEEQTLTYTIKPKSNEQGGKRSYGYVIEL